MGKAISSGSPTPMSMRSYVRLGFFGGLFGALDFLELVDGSGLAVLIAADALGEEFLDVWIAHG